MNNYYFVAILGIFLKLYDDLDELFFFSNQRIMECIKTIFIIISCYFLFTTSNKYSILWYLFFWGFLPLVDWYAFTSSPYFFSLVLLMSSLCIFQIFFNGKC
jgi:hypothetical protein